MFERSDGYLNRPKQIAEGLRRLADDLAGMPDDELPLVAVTVGLQFCHWSGSDEQRRAAVDLVATRLLGIGGQAQRMSNGSWHYGTPYDGREVRDGITVSLFTGLTRRDGGR